MENHVEAVIIGPGREDLPMLERLLARGDIAITAGVSGGDGDAAGWFRDRGIEVYGTLEEVPRVLPGCLLVALGGDPLPIETARDIQAGSLYLVGREVVELMAGGQPAADAGEKVAAVFKSYRRLLEDYSPTSRSSSTSVKLAACLAEASTIWSASGGAILTGAPGGGTVALVTHRGADLPRDLKVPASGSGLVERCFSLDRHMVARDLIEGGGELLPGVSAASAACVSLKSSSSIHGLLLLWSSEKEHFEEADLNLLALFGYYAGVLLEVDLLGDKLEENLMIDPLTGLNNRRQFNHRLGLEVKRAERYTLNISLVIMKVDNLKEYNNACGHMLGNLALSDIALIIEKGTREVDCVARIGDDEFALLLPETNRLGALKLADRLRSDVASYPFPVPEGGEATSLTVSAGVSSYPGSAKEERELVAQAHEALEMARSAGQSNVKLWESD